MEEGIEDGIEDGMEDGNPERETFSRKKAKNRRKRRILIHLQFFAFSRASLRLTPIRTFHAPAPIPRLTAPRKSALRNSFFLRLLAAKSHRHHPCPSADPVFCLMP
jgi:hypothetical protein